MSRGSASSGTSRSRARVWTASAPTSVPTTRDPDVGEREQEQRAARGRDVRRAGRAAGRTKAGTEHELEQRRGSTSSASALATSSAVRSTGRQEEAVEAALLAVGDEQPADAEHRREQQRHRTARPAARSPSTAAALQREVEDHERRDRESAMRGDDLRRAQLEAQVLAAARAPTARRISGTAPRSRPCRPRPPAARSSARPPRSPSARSASASPPAGSWLVTTRVRPLAAPDERLDERRRRPGRGWRAARRAAARSGSCRTARPTASRCTIPRENVWTRVVGARGSGRRARAARSTRAAATPCRRAWKRRFSRALRSR